MPIFKYRCPEHGDFEELSKDPLNKCPDCGKKVKRLFGKPAVHYNALGFTKNWDYGTKGGEEK